MLLSHAIVFPVTVVISMLFAQVAKKYGVVALVSAS